MGILNQLKEQNYRWGDLQAIPYSRTETAIFKPGFLGELYFKFRGSRFSRRDGTGILENLFCGMTDLSYDAIVPYLAGRPICVLGVWQGTEFKVAGFNFTTVSIGAGEHKACFAGYGFTREFWGTDEEEVLAVLGITVIFQELDVLSIHGVRYADNDFTAHFMRRFGFRDVGTLPNYMMKRGKLVDGVISTLSRETFEAKVEAMISEV